LFVIRGAGGNTRAPTESPLADVIFVVKDQRLAERGTHAELLTAGGFYAELHGIQFATAGAGV
jgi:ABC-type multidrug transport system fused ATPase/permease subunit